MLTDAVQVEGGHFHPGQAGLLGALILVACVVCIGAVVVPLLGVAMAESQRALRSWRGRRRRLRAAASSELRARAMMSELCPHGWRAQITMVGGGEADVAGDGSGADGGRRGRVALDWAELQDENGRPAVMRRVWAPTIGQALEAMVADRRTDEALEDIELRARAEGMLWPDH